MHNQLFFAWLPFGLLLIGPILQLVLCILRLKSKIKFEIGASTLVSIITGIILSVAATWLSMLAAPVGMRCVTGCLGFAVLGIMASIIITPIIGIISYVIYLEKNKVIIAE